MGDAVRQRFQFLELLGRARALHDGGRIRALHLADEAAATLFLRADRQCARGPCPRIQRTAGNAGRARLVARALHAGR